MKNKTLLIVFVSLLALYLFSRLFSGDRETRSFNPQLFTIDTARVSSIEFYAKADSFAQVKLEKLPSGWSSTKGQLKSKITAQNINALLEQLTSLKAQRIVSKAKEKWADSEIGDQEATAHVKVFEDNKLTADFWLGRLKIDQQKRSVTSFIRTADKDDVYALESFIGMAFTQGFNGFRDRTLLAFNKNDITKVAVSQDGVAYSFAKGSAGWTTDTGQPLDSTKVDAYLANLSSFPGNSFADNFTENQSNILSRQSITFTGNNMNAPISVECLAVADYTAPFVCQSSLNPDTWFSGDSTALFSRLFKQAADLQ